MPRSSNAHRGGALDGAIMACDRIISGKNECEKRIKQLQVDTCLLAEKLAIQHGEVTKALLGKNSVNDGANNVAQATSSSSSSTSADIDMFLLEQRTKLKQICEGNAKRLQDNGVFIQALHTIRDDLANKKHMGLQANGTPQTQQDNNDGDDSDDEPVDYTKLINDKIDQMRQNAEEDDMGVDDSIENHEFSREIRTKLGEKLPKQKKKRSRNSRGGGEDEDSDDDLEVIPDHNTGTNVNDLKCDITGMLYENPLKNKVCKHVYSKAGWEQMVRTGKRKCPVFGCTNTHVTQEQLEEDYETTRKVEQYKKKLEYEKSQARMYEDDDEDF